jgi:hypothetical protein
MPKHSLLPTGSWSQAELGGKVESAIPIFRLSQPRSRKQVIIYFLAGAHPLQPGVAMVLSNPRAVAFSTPRIATLRINWENARRPASLKHTSATGTVTQACASSQQQRSDPQPPPMMMADAPTAAVDSMDWRRGGANVGCGAHGGFTATLAGAGCGAHGGATVALICGGGVTGGGGNAGGGLAAGTDTCCGGATVGVSAAGAGCGAGQTGASCGAGQTGANCGAGQTCATTTVG